ncbi:uncharacterized protein LOC127854602 [Dreissena polymorpha]|uniref:Uncharacterized protein n=1 Tax=Dreissena polymorpha TaxID=45954 RepID=A0A9D4HGX4_DREPO|nr:uncharacterized protein LOC127854602 [Dreissena polymorpha]KAH3718625.1 hypothetical protein DPMN_061431 [Dreissena polymorpha]
MTSIKSKLSREEKDGMSNKRRSTDYKGDILQVRLLQMESKYRSKFLFDQIRSFEDKVYLSFEQFNVDAMYHMFTALCKRTVIDRRKIKTIGQVRKMFTDLKKLIRCKKLHRHVEMTEDEEKLVKYFNWFFQFLDYTRNLRDNFVDRIYTPLFRYFYNIGFDVSGKDELSEMTTRSAMSARSTDSGYSGMSALSGMTSVLAGAQNVSARFDADSKHAQRRKIVTRNALIALSRQFQNIKHLYDTTVIERLAARLSHLKDRIDYLLDQENSLDPVLLGQDSETPVFHLKIRELGCLNLVRIIPDVLMKFQKAAWLAQRWLENDDEKTKDLNEQLNKLNELEEEMNKRLNALSYEIQISETQLESNADMLTKLLQREERAGNLAETVYILKNSKGQLEEKLEVLNSERTELQERLTRAAEGKDKNLYQKMRPLYERNKLQRFAVERQLNTLNFRISLIESDMHIELEAKTNIIHTTNEVQDKCEELEQMLERARQEQKAIQTALIPIVEDRNFVQEQLHANKGIHTADSMVTLKAEFVSSHGKTSEKQTRNENEPRNSNQRVGVFITSMRTNKDTISATYHAQKIPETTMATVKQITTPLYYPEVGASEW